MPKRKPKSPTEQLTPEQRKERLKERLFIPGVMILLFLPLLIGFLIFSFVGNQPEVVLRGDFYDQSASEIQEDIDHEVKDGYFNMSLNTTVPVFSDNTAMFGIKNVPDNEFDCIVTVTLEDGTEIYKSGGLAPGNELELVTLSKELESGEHEATALFEIYEQDEAHTKVGQTASKVTLHVQ